MFIKVAKKIRILTCESFQKYIQLKKPTKIQFMENEINKNSQHYIFITTR